MLLKVLAEDFRSYPKLSYTVNHTGFVAVEGSWAGAPDRSNGSGKSSFLPDLLCWAIYGETTGGQKAVCRRGQKGCQVTVTLPFVSFTRSQKADGTGNKLQIAGINHRKLADAEAYLSQLFPPREVFASTIILGQGVGERFSAWTPAERARVLRGLLDLNCWSSARQKLRPDREFQQARKAQLQGVQATLKEALGRIRGLQTERGDEELDAEKLQAALVEINTSIVYSTDQAQTFENEMRANQARHARDQGILAGLQSSLKAAKAERKLLGLGKCPTCGRQWPKKHMDAKRTDLDTKIADIESQSKALVAQSKHFSGKQYCCDNHLQYHRSKLAELRARVQELSAKLSRAQTLESEVKEYEEQLAAKQQEAKAADEDLSNLAILDRAFTEIPVLKMDGLLVSVNQHLVEVCSSVWDSEFLVQLVSEKTLKKGGQRAEIGLSVMNQAGSYEASSWGQRRKIDLSVQLALRGVLLTAWPQALPLLVCDDVADVLDCAARRSLYEKVLVPESKKSAVFVLGADPVHPIPVPERITIGYSLELGSAIAHHSGSAPLVIEV